MRRAALVVLLMAFCSLPSGAAAPAVPVSGDEVGTLFVGRTAHRTTRSGLPIAITFHRDGTLVGVVQVGARSDSGRWWVSEGRLCYQWQRLANARTSCISVVAEGQRIVVGSRWEGYDELGAWLAGGPRGSRPGQD